MNYTSISISDARAQLPEIAERVARNGEIFALKKWGKIKGYFVSSISNLDVLSKEDKMMAKRRKILAKTAGIYANKREWKGKTSSQIVQEIRDSEEAKYANLFD